MDYAEFIAEADQINHLAATVFGKRSRSAEAFAKAFQVAVAEARMFAESEESSAQPAPTK